MIVLFKLPDKSPIHQGNNEKSCETIVSQVTYPFCYPSWTSSVVYEPFPQQMLYNLDAKLKKIKKMLPLMSNGRNKYKVADWKEHFLGTIWVPRKPSHPSHSFCALARPQRKRESSREPLFLVNFSLMTLSLPQQKSEAGASFYVSKQLVSYSSQPNPLLRFSKLQTNSMVTPCISDKLGPAPLFLPHDRKLDIMHAVGANAERVIEKGWALFCIRFECL